MTTVETYYTGNTEVRFPTRFWGHIGFVEDYDIHIAHYLVQGVDVWLNTPLVTQEASGTSGMKAGINGVPHLSVLDGWWYEAYDGTNGWAIVGDNRLKIMVTRTLLMPMLYTGCLKKD